MRIRSVHITEFRSLRDSQITHMSGQNIFHGDNDTGKSNLLRGLELIFRRKTLSIAVQHDPGVGETVRRLAPFWIGEIEEFSDNFYMRGQGPVTFDIVIEMSIEKFGGIDANGILSSINEEGHDFRVRLKGRIERNENNGIMVLTDVWFNDQPAMHRVEDKEDSEDSTVWLPERSEQKTMKREVVESVLDSFNDLVAVIPASRFLADESISDEEVKLHSRSFKNWLHNKSLSRDGYEVYQKINKWFAGKPMEWGEISFLRQGDALDLMIAHDHMSRIRIDEKGTGVQQMLVLFGYIAQLKAGVIAVEEPELNLSFKNQDRMINVLRDLVEREDCVPHQVLITTHSDHIGSRGDLSRFRVEKENGSDTTIRKFTNEDRRDLFPRRRW